MRFTRWTYLRAIRRSFHAEYLLYREFLAALRGPEAWSRQVRHSHALVERYDREKGKWRW